MAEADVERERPGRSGVTDADRPAEAEHRDDRRALRPRGGKIALPAFAARQAEIVEKAVHGTLTYSGIAPNQGGGDEFCANKSPRGGAP